MGILGIFAFYTCALMNLMIETNSFTSNWAILVLLATLVVLESPESACFTAFVLLLATLVVVQMPTKAAFGDETN